MARSIQSALKKIIIDRILGKFKITGEVDLKYVSKGLQKLTLAELTGLDNLLLYTITKEKE